MSGCQGARRRLQDQQGSNNVSRRRFWPLQRGRGRLSQEAGAALFQGLRVRLTLWYSAVLAVAFVLFGVALYFGVQLLLFSPIQIDLAAHAHAHTRQLFVSSYWACSSSGTGPGAVPPDQPSFNGGQPMPELVACFDQNATLVQANGTTQLPTAFLSNTLAQTALQRGTVTDMVDAGGTIGPIYRYATVVSSPDGSVRVLQVGLVVRTEENALSVLLMLLLI